MPAKARSEVFDPFVVGTFCCSNELVRSRHLLGDDHVAEKDLNYRKLWLQDQFQTLSLAMAIQVLDFSILGNMFTVILRNRPDIVAALTDEEVARRWWQVCPKKKDDDGNPLEPSPDDLAEFLEDIDEYRRRLSDISWMMRLAQQRVARRANMEDGAVGSFFAHRFTCEPLECDADILWASLSLGLECIRAGQATTLKESNGTAIVQRIQMARKSRRGNGSPDNSQASEDDHWLAPFGTKCPKDDTGGETSAVPYNIAEVHGEREASGSDEHARIGRQCFLPMSLDEYLAVIQTLACSLPAKKLKRIPNFACSALKRIGVRPRLWLGLLLDQLLNEPSRAARLPV